MKEWKISYLDQDGVVHDMLAEFDDCPSIEEAATWVRARLFPVAAELDVNDFQDRVSAPIAKSLKAQNGVQITDIKEVA